MVEMARPQVGLRRVASVEDMRAQVVMFCRAELTTGQVLAIDGGMPGRMHRAKSVHGLPDITVTSTSLAQPHYPTFWSGQGTLP